MAKLTAPLFSFGASGALAKALVYFPWKGLNVVRQYVVPANPKSDAQVAQRAFLTAAVDEIHAGMVYPSHPLTSADKSAYSLLASVKGIIMTWFNSMAKTMIDAMIDLHVYMALVSGACTYLAATTATAVMWSVKEEAPVGDVFYGTSKTALLKSVAANFAAHTISVTLTGLTVGTTYYWQWRKTAVGTDNVQVSGIYVYKHEP